MTVSLTIRAHASLGTNNASDASLKLLRKSSKKLDFGGATRAVLICSLVLLGSLLAVPMAASNSHSLVRSTILGPPAGAPFDHIVTIMMENQGLCDIYTGCGGSAQYMSSLANANTLVMTWGTIGHNSEPNYISLIGGFDDTNTNGDGVCCFFETQPNLIDRMESAGLTWQAFAEDAHNSNTQYVCPFNPPRSGDHFPFIDFSDMNTNSRCSHFLTTASSSDPEFLAALNMANPANFIWLTPNDCNNGHNSCSSSSGIAGGDSYLSALVPHVLSSSEFTSTKAALLILYDEGYSQCSNTGGTGECVYASFSGPVAKKGVQISPVGASHYSYLSMIEAAWGLPSLNSRDASAPNILGAFGACTSNCPPSTSFTISTSAPVVNSVVTFTATTTGGRAPYTITWSFGDRTTGTGVSVTHTYASAQSFTVTENVTDSSTPSLTATSSRTITVKAFSWGTFLGLSTSIWLIIIGVLIGFVASLALLTIRARANLKRAKETMNQQDR